MLIGPGYIPNVPEPMKLMQEEPDLKAILNYTVRCYLSMWDPHEEAEAQRGMATHTKY